MFKDPLGIVSKQVEVTSAVERKAETARVTNLMAGVCPICQKRMSQIAAGPDNIESYVCLADNVCLPVENKD